MYSSALSKSTVLLLTLAALATVSVSSCRTQSGGTDTFIPAVPDWSDKAAWYISEPATAPEADIFYILPTCVWDWTAEDGQLCRYSDYSRTDHIEAFMPSVELAEDIFAQGQYGFYCPYYRQITLNVWMDGETAVEELAQYPQLFPAMDSTGTGTIICYNSVATPDAACGVLSPSDVCINPVNWTINATPAELNDSVTVTVDTDHHLLIVDGLDPEHYYAPSLASTFPLGNYHLQELTLYQDHLRRNTALRVRNFELDRQPGTAFTR